MSDTDTTIETQPDPDEPKGLRKQLNDAHAIINKQRSQLLAGAYDQLGLNPDQGLGKAIAKEFDGEPTFEALAAFAKDEYGYVGENAPPTHEAAPAIAQGQAALDQVGEQAGSVPLDPSEQDRLSRAEAERDYAATMRLKADEVAGWFGGGSNP